MHSAVFLAATLFAVAGIFLTLHAEFLAGVQVIVYVGGILVLFVFVIMLIAVERAESRTAVQPAVDDCARHVGDPDCRNWLTACTRAGIRFVLPRPVMTAGGAGVTGNSQLVGTALYTTYLLPFEIASILLLVAIVGAVVLCEEEDAGGR